MDYSDDHGETDPGAGFHEGAAFTEAAVVDAEGGDDVDLGRFFC